MPRNPDRARPAHGGQRERCRVKGCSRPIALSDLCGPCWRGQAPGPAPLRLVEGAPPDSDPPLSATERAFLEAVVAHPGKLPGEQAEIAGLTIMASSRGPLLSRLRRRGLLRMHNPSRPGCWPTEEGKAEVAAGRRS